MVGEAFQLSGAILTIYSVVSLGNKAVRQNNICGAVYSGQKIETLIERYAERNYAWGGMIFIVIGYILPLMQIDISIANLLLRLLVFLGATGLLVGIGVIASKKVAKIQFDKEVSNK